MKILFADTSGKSSWMALFIGEKGIVRNFGESRRLFSTVREVIKQAEIEIRELDYFIAGVGPGSYTGIRVAVAGLQAMALGAGKEFFMVNSLSMYYRDCPVVVDARRGGIYFYGRNPETVRVYAEEEFVKEMGGWPRLITPILEPLRERLMKMGYRGELIECREDVEVVEARLLESISCKDRRVNEILYLQ